MNSTDYLILPPANSVLIFVMPAFDLFVTCKGGSGEFNARLSLIGEGEGLHGCNVDNGNCEDSCTEFGCMCSNNQTLIQTSCVCKFSMYRQTKKHYCICLYCL